MADKPSEIALFRPVVILFLSLLTLVLPLRGGADSYPHTFNSTAGNRLEISNSASYSEFFIRPALAYVQSLPARVISAAQAPALHCPEDISTYTDINTCTSYITNGLNPEFDPAAAVSLTWEMDGATVDASPPRGINLIDDYTFNEGTTIVTYTITGAGGAVASCSFTVTISDNQVPRLDGMPGNISVVAAPGQCSAPVYWTEPAVSDNCTPAHLIRRESTARPGDEFPAGTTRVYYTAIDAMGNESAVRSFTVTVEDREPPVLILPPDITIACEEPLPAPWSSWQQLISAGGNTHDNCGLNEASFALLSETQTAETCPYTLTRTYTIADAAGNSATAEHRIAVTGEAGEIPLPPPEEVILKGAQAGITTAVGTGNWDDTATWDNGVPDASTDAVIPGNFTVTINTAAESKDITIESGGTLNHSGATTLQVYGDWANNGTYNGGTNGIIEFVGSANAVISGTTTFEEVIINKGSLSTLLNINGDISISGGGSLEMNSGLVTIPAGSSFSLNFSNGFRIERDAGFDLSGGTFSSGNFTITNEGLIRINSGTATFGNQSGNSVNNQNNAAFIVSSGTVNMAGRLHSSATGTLTVGITSGIHISGGIVTLSTVGQGLGGTGSLNVTAQGNFNFTGGAIVFQNPSTSASALDLGIISGTGNKNTQGGTFQFGNSSTPSNSVFNISSDIPLHSVTTSNNVNLILEKDLVISGQLQLNGSSKLNLNSNTLQIPVTGTGTYSIPLVDGSGNSIPFTIQFTGGNFATGASVEIATIDSKHPQNASAANYLNRYWTVELNGITNPVYNITASYTNADIAGNESNIAAGLWTGSLPWGKGNNVNTVNKTISVTGITGTPAEITGITADPPTVSIAANPTSICNGGSTTLTATANGDPVITYSWSPATGLSNANIANPVASPATTTTYTVTVTDGNGLTATDNVMVTVLPQFVAGSIGSSQTICYNTIPAQLTGAVPTGGDTPYSYQWQIFDGTSWNDISGATELNYLPGQLTSTTRYRLAQTSSNGCGTLFTNEVTITVLPQFAAGSISSLQTICYNTVPAQLTGIAPTGGDTPYSYRWQVFDGTNWNDISGATGLNYSPGQLISTTRYRLAQTSSNGCGVLYTNEITVTVLPQLTAGSVSSPQSICYDTSPQSLSATTATGGSGSGYVYQWQSSADGTNWSNIPGATSLVYSPSALTSTTHYRVVATDNATYSCGSAESSPVEITLAPELIVDVSASNIACSNSSATVTFNVSGGTPPYTRSFNGVTISGNTVSNVAAGTYTWSVTDAMNCGPFTGSITITEPDPIVINSATVTNAIICNGGTAMVTITASGGTGNLQYTFNGQTNNTGVFTGVYAGINLSYSVTDANGCGPVNGTITVDEPPAIIASAAVTTPIDCNGGTATVTITASGGTGNLQYTFNGQTNNTGVFSGIAAGSNFAWSVTDTNGCGPVGGTLTVTQPDALTASVSETASISCYDGTADIRITAAGGTGTKTYSFQGQADNTTGIFSGILAGTYNWSVTDDNNCTVSDTYTIQQPADIVITSIGSNSEICQGETLTLNSTATGGTGTLRYSWSGPNGFTSSSPNPSIAGATPAASGTYTLTVTDANNCTASATTTVTVHATPAVTATPATQTVCAGSQTLITFSGAENYTWTNNNTSIGLGANGSGNISFTAVNDGDTPVTATITVIPAGSGCTGTPTTVTITVNPIPELQIVNSTPVLCNSGITTISLSSNVPGTTYSWAASRVTGSTTGHSAGSGNTIQQNLSGAGTVEYTITPTANGCIGDPVQVQVQVISSNYNLDVITSGPNKTDFCPGENFSINFQRSSNGEGSGQTSTGWFSRTEWQWNTRFHYTISNPSITASATSGGPIDSPGNLNFNLINNTNEVQTAIISITPWSYYRERSCGLLGCGSYTSWQQLCSGNAYTVTITVQPFAIECPEDIVASVDAGQCYATVNQPAPGLSCGTGANLSWSAPGAPASGSGGLSGVQFPVGTTTVTYTATKTSPAMSRTCSFTVAVTDDEPPVISNCPEDFDNLAMDDGECGAVVTWNEPTATDNCGNVTLVRTDGSGLNSGDLFPAGTTTISYLATDAAGNISTCSFDINVQPDNQLPVLTCVEDQSGCAPAGGKYTHTGTGWDAGATDNCGGTITKTYTLSGATTGSGTSLSNVEFNVGTTTVEWTATDRGGNIADCTFDVVVSETPAVTIAEGSQSVCLNGAVTFTATATGTPAPSYQWKRDGTNISGETNAALTIDPASAADAGSYTVEVTNSCGSTVSAPVQLTVSTQPLITKQPAGQINCIGGNAEFTVAVRDGIAPYTYVWEMRSSSGGNWSAAGTDSNTLTVSDIGNTGPADGAEFRVTVTDDCGNSVTSSTAKLTVNEVQADFVTTTVCQDGSAAFSVSTSGSTPAGYAWFLDGDPISNGGAYSGATTQTLTINNAQVEHAGTYSVVVTFNITQPANSCEISVDAAGELIVDEGPAIEATLSEQTICPANAITEIVLSNANGTPNTTYTWTRDNTTILTGIPASGSGDIISGTLFSSDPQNSQTTTFTITAEANGCISTGTVTVTVVDDQPPVAICKDITVALDNTGKASIIPGDIDDGSNDNCSETVLLAIDKSDFDCTNLGSNTVILTVTDDWGNTATCQSTVTVIDETPPVAKCKDKDIDIQLDASGYATISPEDIDDGSTDNCGIAELSLDITSFDCTNLGPNTVTLTVKDAAGNTATCTAIVTLKDDNNPVAIQAVVTQTDIDCYGGTASVTITATDGVGVLTYTFDGVSQSSGKFDNIPAGTYNWSVTDQFGCGDISGSYTVVQVEELAANVAATEVNCSSGNDGSIVLSDPKGGSGDYEFSADGGLTWQSGLVFSGLTPGFYNVQMRDKNVPSCVVTLHTGLEVYIITATLTSTDITCFGANDGKIEIASPAGGMPPYQYSVDGGGTWQNSGSFTGLSPGNYDVRIADNTGCEITLNSNLELDQPDELQATVNHTDVSCFGAGDATITITDPQGGSGSFEFSIDGTNWQASGSFAALGPVTYTVSIRDANMTSCVVILENALQITELPEITASVTSSDISCNNAGDGKIEIISAAGGTGSYEYSVDGGNTWHDDALFENLTPGTYNVQIRDKNAVICVLVLNDNLALTEPPALVISTQPLSAAACEGEAVTFSVATTDGVGTVHFEWQKEISGVWTALSDGGNISGAATGELTISGIATADNGSYRVVVKDDCVPLISDIAVLIVNEITDLIPAGDISVCEGEDVNFEVSTAGETPAGYQWQTNASGTWADIPGATGDAYTVSGATPGKNGDYRVVVIFPATSGSCALTSPEINLEVKPMPVVGTDLPELTFCLGVQTDAIPLSGQPAGVVFDITVSGANIGLTSRTGVSEIPSFMTNSAGSATVTVTPRADGCAGAPVTFTISVNPRPNVSVSPLRQTICSGGTTNIALSYPDGATISWYYTVTSGTVDGATTAEDVTVTHLEEMLVNNSAAPATIDYFITAKKDGCEGSPTKVTITVNPAAVATIAVGETEVCQNDEDEPVITFEAIGGAPPYKFTYTVNGGAAQQITTYGNDHTVTLPVPTGADGTFIYKLISVTEGGNCINEADEGEEVTIEVKPAPQLTSSLTPPGICSNTAFDYTPTANFPETTFSWSRAAIAGISNPPNNGTDDPDEFLENITNDPIPVVYTYTLELNGCTNIQEVVVMVTPAPVLDDYSPPSICSGQVFSYKPSSPTSGTTFTWTRAAQAGISNPAASGTGNPNEELINTTSGPIGVEYEYTLSSNNCENPVTYPVVVVVVPAPNVTASASPTVICPGESVNLFSSSDIPNQVPTTLLSSDFETSQTGWTRDPNNNNASSWNRSNNYNIGSNNYINNGSWFYVADMRSANSTSTLTSPVMNTVGYNSLTLEFSDYYRDNGSFQGDYAYIDVSTNGGSSWTTLNPPNYNSNTTHGTRTDFANHVINLNAYINYSNFRIRFRYVATRDYYWAIDNVKITGTPVVIPNILWTSDTSDWTSTEANPTGVVVNQTTTFTATYTDPDSNCPGSASVTVTVNDPPDARIDANFCFPKPGGGYDVQLTAEGGAPGATYLWDTGETSQSIIIDIARVYSVTITDNVTGCTATAYSQISEELVINGDFEQGNRDFTSSYSYRDPSRPGQQASNSSNSSLWAEGTYGVGTNARYYHTNFWGRDHTSGSGNFMIVNGQGSDYIVWEQNQKILIQPGLTYYFSAWMLSLNADGNDAELQFEIQVDGQPPEQIGSIAYVQRGQTNNNNPWLQSGRFYGNWSLNPSFTSPVWATLRIINNRTDNSGNDFGLDDISFGTLDPLPVEIELTYDPTCEGDDLKLYSHSQKGLNPKYFWTGPNGWTSDEADPVIENVTLDHADTYHLEVEDDYGCKVSPAQIEVTIHEAPTVDAGGDIEVCTANPVVQLEGDYTAPATSVTWSTDGSGTFDDSRKPDAVYTLHPNELVEGNTITLTLTTNDPDGPCGAVYDQIIITVHNSLEIEVTGTNPLCHNGDDGTASATITVESTAPYIYEWMDSNNNVVSTDATATGLPAGSYTVTVTDDNSCTATETVVLDDPEPFEIDESVDQVSPSCYGAADGYAEVHVSGGTPPYIFEWSQNAGTQSGNTATNLAAGHYTVFVTDANYCTGKTIDIFISQPDPPTLICPGDVEDKITEDGCYMISGEIGELVVEGFCEPYTISYVLSGATTGNGVGEVTDVSFNVGVTTVEYTVEDKVGNILSCDFEVTILRPEFPEAVVECPADYVRADADSVKCEVGVISLNPPAIDDPCNEIVSVINNSPYRTSDTDANGDYPVGITTFEWIITDISGNTKSCEVTVEVEDITPPVIDCLVPEGEMVEDEISGDGCTLTHANIPDPVITENCGIASLTYELSGATTGSSPQTGINYVRDATLNVGITHVAYTVTDVGGNTATCEFDIWIKNIDNPPFTVTCPSEDAIGGDAGENCEGEIAIPVPAIDNPCNEDFTVTLLINGVDVPVTLPLETEIIQTLEVGEHSIKWIITDASGRENPCELTVTVRDVESEIKCPADIVRTTDNEEVDYASNVQTGEPAIDAVCIEPLLNWTLTPPAGYEDKYGANDLEGTGFYTETTFYLGETTITYYLTDDQGNLLYDKDGEPLECEFTVTVILKSCPEDITEDVDENCEYIIDPGTPVVASAHRPLVWKYTIEWADERPDETNIFDEADEGVPGPPALGEIAFPAGVTTIYWTVTNSNGVIEIECEQIITIVDDVPPTFTGTLTDLEECVDMLYSAVYNPGNDDVLRYLDHNNVSPQPYPIDNGAAEDFFLFVRGENFDLDLKWEDFEDNCCDMKDSRIDWTITFDEATPHGMGGTSVSGTGQPSAHNEDIKLWGDRVNYQSMTHTITFIVTDCNDIEMEEPIVRKITILPRPQIVKQW